MRSKSLVEARVAGLSFRLLVAGACATALLAGASPAPAATLTWDATTGNSQADDGAGTWNTTNTNWWNGSGNVSWSNSPADSAVFGVGGTGAFTVALGEPITSAGITFYAGPTYTLSGNTLTLAGSITVNSAEARIDSAIAGGTVHKYGSGKLILAGDSTFGTGSAMDVRGGIVNLRHDHALGNSSYCHVTSPNYALEVQDGITVSNGLYIKGQGAAGAGSLRSVGGDNTWAGYVRLHWDNPNAAIGVDTGSTLTVTGQVQNAGGSGGALTKLGDGTLILASSNSYTWPTYVNAGVLNIRHGNALGTTAGGTTVASGATLQLENNITVAGEPLVLNGSGVNGGDALRSLSGDNAWNGPVTENSAHIQVDAGTLTINGQINGSGTFRKYGSGTLVLTGDNTYSATTDLVQGVLNIQHDNALGVSSYCHVYGNATLELENDITVPRGLYIGNNNSSSTAVNLHNASGDNAWTGTVHIHASHPWAIIGVEPGTSLTIDGPIDAYNGTSGSLTKVGDGTLTLNGSSSFRTPTFVDEGVPRALATPMPSARPRQEPRWLATPRSSCRGAST